MSNSRVVGDEPTIEIGKAEEGVYILDFGRSWPGSDAVEFDWVHDKLTRFDNILLWGCQTDTSQVLGEQWVHLAWVFGLGEVMKRSSM